MEAAPYLGKVGLVSAPDKAGFYGKLGFQARPENAPGMDMRVKLLQESNNEKETVHP